MKRIITLAAIAIALSLPVTAHSETQVGLGNYPWAITIYINGHLLPLDPPWYELKCDGSGPIFCWIDVWAPYLGKDIEDFDGYSGQDATNYYFKATQTSPTTWSNNDNGSITMSWNKADLDATYEAFCEGQ